MRERLKSIGWRVPVALAATYVFFGSGPAAASAAIKTLPPFLLVAVRGLIAGAILTIWSVRSGTDAPILREWRAGAIIGVLILAGGAGAGTYGQLTVPSGVAGVLSAMLPLLAACMGFIMFRERIAKRAIIGLIIGFAGIGLLLRPGSNLNMFGITVIVAGQVSWALGAELAPRVGLPDDPRLAAGIELLSGALSCSLSHCFSATLADFISLRSRPYRGWASAADRHRGRRFHRLRVPYPECGTLDRDDVFLRQPGRRDHIGLVAL